MTTYITSDLHFGHKSILVFNPKTRPYSDVEHMNFMMKETWNARVRPEDTVYILGDVAFMAPRDAAELVAQLNGKKILIRGNHDGKLVAEKKFRDCFVDIQSYYEVVSNGVKVCMFHYPIAEWNQCHRGAVQLHGHLHGKPSGLEQYRVRDAGMDATGQIVVPLEELVAQAMTGEIKAHGDSTHA